ncbi:MAG: FecR domain-containing protein [Flavobacteriales bacterium]|nr:FecR domain-containing protein [Flavobacteriales bacterium]
MKGEIEMNDSVLMAYINDELSAEAKASVDRWLLASDQNMSHFNQLKSSWELTGELDPHPVAVDTDKAWDKVLNQISSKEEKVIPLKPSGFNRRWIGIAAGIVILLGVFSIFKFIGGENPEGGTLVSSNSILVDTLGDGSIISLNENSSLAYSGDFNDEERRVELSGEAFFEVERNESKPFIVDLHYDSYVRVLGTSFNIKALEGDSLTEVSVKSGKVEFGSEKEKVILTAGQAAVMNHHTGKITRLDDVSTMVNLYWLDRQLEFDAVNLIDVVEILNGIFAAEVVLECPLMADELIRTSHDKDESIEDVLDVIAEVHGLNVQKNQTEGGDTYTLSCDEL